MKKKLGGKKIISKDELIAETNTYFERLELSHFLEEIQKMEKTLD